MTLIKYDSYIYSLLCDCYYLTDDYRSARDCYQIYFKYEYNDNYSRERFGLVLVGLNLYDLAVRQFRICRLGDGSNSYLCFYIADCFANMDVIDSALIYYKKAIEINPIEALFHNDYGVLLQKNGDFYQALEQFRRATEIDSTNWLYYWNLANVYTILGQKENANMAFKKSKELK